MRLQGYSAPSFEPITPRQRADIICKAMNNSEGDMNLVDGYECDECKNKGVVFFIVEETAPDGRITYRESSRDCRCRKIRSSIRRMKASGLEATISRCTFDKYEVSEEWQRTLKDKAAAFANDVDQLEDKWFFIGGAVGCGKTHLCTAIVREMLRRGKEARYMLWMDDSAKLKAMANDEAGRSMLIDPLKRAEVLYIDDFLKIVRGQSGDELKPTAADVKLAYEILNYRYQQPDLVTIISSERHIADIEKIDSAVGSRIYERTKDNALNVADSPGRNYRTRDMEVV